jgi:hypothetical protein
VRAEIAKNVLLSGKMSYNEYKEYRQKFRRFKEYLELQRKQPEVGEYEVEYTAIDPHVPVIDFSKKEDKDMNDPIKKS